MRKKILGFVFAAALLAALAVPLFGGGTAFAHASVTNPNHCQDLANGQAPGDPATHGMHTARDQSGVVSGTPC